MKNFILISSILFLLFNNNILNAQLTGYNIVIDPGHGGTAPGALGINGVAYPDEKDLNLNISLQLNTMLIEQGATVIMTRTTDTDVSFTARRDLINNNNPDVALSVHLNSYGTPSANGTEVLYYQNTVLAQDLQDNLVAQLGFTDRGIIFENNVTVLQTNSWIPMALTEALFISNQTEWNFINTNTGIQSVVCGHVNGIKEFLNGPLLQIVANFSVSNTNINTNDCVSFTDLSSENPISWYWTFDGAIPNSSTDRNPTNICYNNPGIYEVRLTATNCNGYDDEIKTEFIHVTDQPPTLNADFFGIPTTVIQGGTVSFTDQSTGTPTSWNWSFPGGTPSTSTSQNPSVVYNTVGTYDVSLTVSDGTNSDTETKSGYITVTQSGGTGDIQISGTVFISGTFIPIPNPEVIFNPGGPATTNSNGDYYCNVSSPWSGTITAYHPDYQQGSLSLNNVITNMTDQDIPLSVNPDFYFTWDPVSPNNGEDVAFTAYGVPAGYNYGWCFNDPNSSEFYNISDLENPVHSFFIEGNYNVCLTITHFYYQNSISYCHIVPVNLNQSVPIFPSFSSECQLVDIGTTVEFYDHSNYQYEDYTKVTWIFEWGTNEETPPMYWEKFMDTDISEYENLLTQTHTFNNIGQKLVVLKLKLGPTASSVVREELAGINVIDCDLTSPFYLLGPLSGFMDAVRDEWAYDNLNGPIY
ncbi:MAG: N-acetylmuramoyl-L-alanine amidase, partial [Bacteroidota bacterium]